MGRPKLYHSPEEQRLARNARSRKSYHLRKEDISQTRKSKYAAKHDRSSADVGLPATQCNVQPRDAVPYWQERVERVKIKLDALHPSATPYKFLKELCLECLSSHNTDQIEDVTLRVSELENSMDRYRSEIVNKHGMAGKVWIKAEQIYQEVVSMRRALEQLIASEMMEELQVDYNNFNLDFQGWSKL